MSDSFATLWTVLQPIGSLCPRDFPSKKKKKNWSELPFPSPEDFSNPGIKPTSPVSPALAGGFFTTELPGKPLTRFPLH